MENPSIKYQEFAHKIIALKNNDLNFRNKLIEEGTLGEGYHKAMEEIHIANASKLNIIIDKIGYPTIDKVGKEANEAAWLIIQHSISKPGFMKKCLQLLKIAVEEKKSNPINLAYLTDRIATFQGEAQLYGTQFDWDEDGKLSPNRMDDFRKVNERRASLGLNTVQEQTEVMRKIALEENQSVPADLEKRNREMEEWKKSVGWIK